ncbi:PREDICTED: non-specific lipid-transfer protein 8 [Theobroma cacao]|nr:PREDICTED: non-specific lipid-transfer protein 8 [Theobroma cacao]
MASRIRTPALAAVCLLLLLAAAPASDAAISCSDVIKDLRPCVNYLVNGTGKPPSACCAGASALASAASSSSDKKAACECIKSAAKNMKPNAQLAQALPANCGINLPVTIAPNVDCSKVG